MSDKKIFSHMPRNLLEEVASLPDMLKEPFIALYCLEAAEGRPVEAREVAANIGKARAYTHSLLLQLERLGLVKTSKKGKVKLFSINPELRGKKE
ncbi:MAG: hypothetical protein DRO07_02785 [Candidatus Iainarchaeum archaeon]|uniref:HTH iclR-type domain-containing protein n=1 Tax=Candidatus Iainarchaeum sp. TaxID=3101447 RepID=A0A497JF50_9ARCH|nr:MAG: hypothetical protein DRO07_02785 [Candidatus Diapherotrites archaeon]